MDFLDTVNDSMLEGFYPKGWDMKKIDDCCSNPSDSVMERQSFWNEGFMPVSCETLSEFDTYMGHEIALRIKMARDQGRKLSM